MILRLIGLVVLLTPMMVCVTSGADIPIFGRPEGKIRPAPKAPAAWAWEKPPFGIPMGVPTVPMVQPPSTYDCYKGQGKPPYDVWCYDADGKPSSWKYNGATHNKQNNGPTITPGVAAPEARSPRP